MNKLLIATTNPAKFREISEYVKDLNLELVSLKDFPSIGPVLETGKTFEENAKLKAEGYAAQTGLPTVADDGGLEIDALDGQPGVSSHRWIDPTKESTDEELIAYTLRRMKSVPPTNRTARFKVVVAFCFDGTCETATGVAEGRVAEEAASTWERGFPYRALIFTEKFGKLYKDLSPTEHDQINHRRSALAKLRPIISKRLRL